MLVISPIIRLIAKIISFVLYTVTVMSAFGGWVNPHLFTLPAILTLAFPYIAIMTSLTALFWLIRRRFIIGGLGILSLLACWTPLSMAIPLKTENSPKRNEHTFSLLTWNCLHLKEQKDKDASQERGLNFLLHCGADIIALQELYSYDLGPFDNAVMNSKIDSLYSIYPYRSSTANSDLTVLSKYPMQDVSLHIEQNIHSQCYRFFRFNIAGNRLTLADVHLISFTLSEEERKVITDLRHPGSAKKSIDEFKGSIKGKMGFAFAERAESAEEVCKALEDIKGPVIVCGDFNDVPASWTYRTFLKNGFRDAYAETAFGPTYTFNAHLMLFHLDQIMYRGALTPLSVKREKIDSSDHFPLSATFCFTGNDNS